MAESVGDIRELKDRLQENANKLKETRNKLHKKSKFLAEERDTLNSTIRKLRNEINEHKHKRDDLNERVRHAKDQRDKLNQKCFELKKEIRNIERNRTTTDGISIGTLRKQLHDLETEQMTKPMSPRKEKKIIETISGLHAKIKEQEERINKDPQLKKVLDEEIIYKQKAEKQHEIVEALALRAQQEHENMIKQINKLNNLIQKVNQVQENIVNTKIKADDVHREFIKNVDKIHDLERQISSLKGKQLKKKKHEEDTTIHKEANEIFEKFKRGEKLSTEDLMTLQKAGLL
jgi:uncharacterized coiled-coil DUF342 family protein